MRNKTSIRRAKLVGVLLSAGDTLCPCCCCNMYMQGAEGPEAFKVRYASTHKGNTPSRVMISKMTATVDHLIPKYHGGTDRAENLLIVCRGCNSEKDSLSIPEWVELRRNRSQPFPEEVEVRLMSLHLRAQRSHQWQ